MIVMNIIFSSIKKLIAFIPPVVWKAIFILTLVFGVFYYGQIVERTKWEQEAKLKEAEAAAQIANRQAQVAETNTQIVVENRDRIQVITKEVEVVRERIKEIPINNCIPNDFIRLYDESLGTSTTGSS